MDGVAITPFSRGWLDLCRARLVSRQHFSSFSSSSFHIHRGAPLARVSRTGFKQEGRGSLEFINEGPGNAEASNSDSASPLPLHPTIACANCTLCAPLSLYPADAKGSTSRDIGANHLGRMRSTNQAPRTRVRVKVTNESKGGLQLLPPRRLKASWSLWFTTVPVKPCIPARQSRPHFLCQQQEEKDMRCAVCWNPCL